MNDQDSTRAAGSSPAACSHPADTAGVRAQVRVGHGMVFVTVPTWWRGQMVRVTLDDANARPHAEARSADSVQADVGKGS
jgi:hypothetical protein